MTGCKEKHENLNNHYSFFIKCLLDENFNLQKANNLWEFYEKRFYGDVAFTSGKLINNCLIIHGDLAERDKHMPSEIQSNFKKKQKFFFEYIQYLKNFKVISESHKSLICTAIEQAYENFICQFFYEQKDF